MLRRACHLRVGEAPTWCVSQWLLKCKSGANWTFLNASSLPSNSRVKCRLQAVIYKVLHDLNLISPFSLSSPLVLCAGTTLLSFLFPEPHTCSLTLSSIWNALSPNLGEPGSFSSFRSQLKYLCCREIFWLVLILLPTSHPCSLSQHPGYFPGYGNIDNMQVCGWFVCQWGWGIVYLIHIFILSI
jgi:hypothetical protein